MSSADSKSIKPKTPQDMKLRIKHTKDSIAYNESHMVDHKKALVQARTQLKQTQQALKKTKKG